MSRLHPAIRTGLIYAAIHQACALLGLGALWVAPSLFELMGATLLIADLPSLLMLYALDNIKQFADWRPIIVDALTKGLPEDGRASSGPIVFVLTLGALQWFLIGVFCGWLRLRRESRKRAL